MIVGGSTGQRSKNVMKMMFFRIALLCVLIISYVECVEFSFHATEARGDKIETHRSGSSTGTVAKLHLNKFLAYDFCLRQQTTVTLKSVFFSNDGKDDECFLYLDDILVASFASHSKSSFGAMWNIFENATINKGFKLQMGWHVMKLVLTTGDVLEIDRITVDFSDERITKDVLDCSLICQSKPPTVPKDDTPHLPENGVVSQTSYPTQCAEEDNVKIPIVLQGILEYSVQASLPTYRTFENRRGENTTGCTFLPHVYWKFRDFQIPSKVKLYQSQSAMMTFSGNAIERTAVVRFALRGRSEGHIDADIGSILTIKIRPVNFILNVKVTVIGRTKTALQSMVFLPGQRVKTLTIPDFTWVEKTKNIVELNFRTVNNVSILIDKIQMERRPMKPERTETVFKNERMVVDLVYLDFWWRAPESMTVTIRPDGQFKGDSYDGVAYFRISRPVPWSKGNYAQIFVLYQDGNVRILQLPPSGLDWIPFGSSVVIGATDAYEHRPSAPISTVQIDPINFNMFVSYMDGSFAEIKLISSIDETKIEVKNLRFTKDMSVHPFATLRSMYVADGNSDCDSILIDGETSYHIMDKWLPKNGKSFMFFRQCESKHLTLSPDILVKILKTKYGNIYSWWKPLVNWQKLPAKPSHQFQRHV